MDLLTELIWLFMQLCGILIAAWAGLWAVLISMMLVRRSMNG